MALGYVYRQGLIHRDVKPANLLVTLTNGSITDVKISDFGSVLNLASDVTQVYRVGSLAYMSPEQLDGAALDCRADIYSLGAVLYHLIAGRPAFDAQVQSAMMHQIYHHQPVALNTLRAGVAPTVDAVIQRALAKEPSFRYRDWDEFAQALSALITHQHVPRGQLQGVLDSERFNLLRSLDFFASFGDVELWEVVHRAKWQRHDFGQALYRKGEEGRTFHIIARGELEVFRDGQKVAQLGAGTSVGEMAYLAPSPDLRKHSTDVIVDRDRDDDLVHAGNARPGQPGLPAPLRRGFHPGAGAAASRRARGAGASAPHSLSRSARRSVPACARRDTLKRSALAGRQGRCSNPRRHSSQPGQGPLHEEAVRPDRRRRACRSGLRHEPQGSADDGRRRECAQGDVQAEHQDGRLQQGSRRQEGR